MLTNKENMIRAVSNMKTGELLEELKLVASKVPIKLSDPQHYMLINYTFDSSHENMDPNQLS